MIKVLIVDDHAVLRTGLTEILKREFVSVTCGEAGDAEEARAQVERYQWHLVILDLSLPGRSGIDFLTDLKRTKPRLPVLVLSTHPEDQYARRVLKAGAAGYLCKSAAPEELIRALRKVLAGGMYVSTDLAEKWALELHHDSSQALHDALSNREFEVLRMIASGMTTSQIADELHLSVTTISTFRTRVLEKMNMTTTAALISYAVRNHLVE
jgi:DNA-binding NarL/FixJ family response regulator